MKKGEEVDLRWKGTETGRSGFGLEEGGRESLVRTGKTCRRGWGTQSAYIWVRNTVTIQ